MRQCVQDGDHAPATNIQALQLYINVGLVHIRTLQGVNYWIGVDPCTDTISSFHAKARRSLEGCSKQNRPYVSQLRRKVSMDDYILITALGVTLPIGDTRSNDKVETQSVATMEQLGLDYGCTLYLILKTYFQPPRELGAMDAVSIAKAEHRGISLAQLREIAAQVLICCAPEGWTSTNPRHPKGTLLSPDNVTLYDLMTHYIKPVTEASQCSYVELVTTSEQEQVPQYFCSHWWGEGVLAFIACLEHHARDRGISEHTPYWICAYAINQHNIHGDLQPVTANPQDTPFCKAMQLTKGTVSILDSQAVYFGRIWCVFEIAMVNEVKAGAKKDGNYFHDSYTIAKDENGMRLEPAGVLDHAVPCNHRFRRQATFPLQTCHKALGMNLEEAVATVELDKQFILKSIIDLDSRQSLSEKAPTTHAAYDELNTKLRAKIAEATYCTALQKGDPEIDQFRQAFAAASCGHLVIFVRGCPQFRNEARHLVQVLPSSLVGLELDIGFVDFYTTDEFATGLGRLQNLRSLKLVASWCQNLTKTSKLWFELEQMHSLTELQLDFSCCKALSSIHGLGLALQKLSNLVSLRLSFADCESVSSVDSVWKGLMSSTKLLQFDIDLSYTVFISMESLGNALSTMHKLEGLSLKLEDSNVDSIDMLASGLRSTILVSELKLCLSGNRLLSSLDSFSRALKGFFRLRSLELDCSCCNALTSLDVRICHFDYVDIVQPTFRLSHNPSVACAFPGNKPSP